MRSNILLATVLATMAAIAAPVSTGSAADLEDLGPAGEFFHDPDSGLYWFDPAVFVGQVRSTMDSIDAHCPAWSWATSAQIDGLLGRSGPAGVALTEVIGPHQVDVSGYRWLGFYAETDPDGWLAQTTNDPHYDTITWTGSQNGAATLDPGGWFVSTSDPVAAPRLEDCGDDGEFFLDQATLLYWRDPDFFAGQPRAAVDTWLADHPGWRWATAAEVFGLLCRLTEGDVSLVDVMGEPQYWATGPQPRWIGFYEQADEPDGILLQCGYRTSHTMLTIGSTQANAAAAGAGAWVVTAEDPTPTAARSWSEVKGIFQ